MSAFRPGLYSSPLPSQYVVPDPWDFHGIRWWGYKTIDPPKIGTSYAVDWARQIEESTGADITGRSGKRGGKRGGKGGKSYGLVAEGMLAKKALAGLGPRLFWLAVAGGVLLWVIGDYSKKRRR